MKSRRIYIFIVALTLFAAESMGAVFADLRGVVRDQNQKVIKGAQVTLRSRTSSFTKTEETNDSGEFLFRAIPAGEYSVTVESSGFNKTDQSVLIATGDAPIMQFRLAVSPVSHEIDINETTRADLENPTPVTITTRQQIEQTPGASRTNSLAMVTDYVPGAYVTHNQLHIRGGHQVSWLIDGVPVPNTNIADTVGPQFDPKDIDYLETQRGGYSSEYGDRTYGIFNLIPRSGFERNREAELTVSVGNFFQTNDQISFGDHTGKLAYYVSLSGNRSNYGLETPVSDVLHDQSNGFSVFASIIYNLNKDDQLRFVTSWRADYFQVPNDQDAQALGIRDAEQERDGFVAFTWAHTAGQGLLTVSPFYHYNRANFVGGPNDTPISTRDDRTSNYAGAQVAFSWLTKNHNAKIGVYSFYQTDSTLFGLTANDGSGLSLKQQIGVSGHLAAAFVEDQFKLTSWLTLTGGLRFTHFGGTISENAATPRAGVAIRIPRLNWTIHGFYGRYYQAPPLTTVSGPLLAEALSSGLDFLPLHGERDEEQQFGLTIPFKGWTLDTDYFRTWAKNYFDHDALGNSNIFLPLTIERARIRAVESTLRSPQIFHRAQVTVAYSHQRIEGLGSVTGGLTDFSPPSDFFLLDHDQRDTLSAGVNVTVPWQSFIASDIHYGSGFLDGDGPQHLPHHTTVDLSLGKSFGENWSVAFHSVNLGNSRFLLDNSNTFGGTHFAEPRQIYVELRFRFHY